MPGSDVVPAGGGLGGLAAAGATLGDAAGGITAAGAAGRCGALGGASGTGAARDAPQNPQNLLPVGRGFRHFGQVTCATAAGGAAGRGA